MADNNAQGQDLPPHFKLNEILQRTTLHDRYGGNRQAGISTPARYPFIFIFSGATGQRHGYKDQWENDDVFSYTGEGQTGDMQLTKGNLALAEHLNTGKRCFCLSTCSGVMYNIKASWNWWIMIFLMPRIGTVNSERP